MSLVLVVAAAGCSSAPDLPDDVRASETVWCADAAGVVDMVTWPGHDGPLPEIDVKVVELDAGPVSEDDLLDACARRFRWPTRTTLCEAYADPESLDRFSRTEFVSETHGGTGPDRPGFPVVVRGHVTCEDVQLRARPGASLAGADDFPVADHLRGSQTMRQLNDWRSREATWRDAADDGCLDVAAARQHALAARSELEGDWPVFETARDPEHPSHAGLCFDVRLRREGFIEVGYHAVETPHGRSDPVDSYTDVAEPDSPDPR